jgi:hypothetical protein
VSAYADTAEQTAIIDAARTGENLVINAGAGTGKTTTLRRITEELGGRGLYLAYNRTTALDAKARFPRQVQCMTAHAIAYSKVVKGTSRVERLRGGRVPPSEQARILGITGPTRLSEEFLAAPWQLMRLINGAVRGYCNSADRTIDRWHVPVLPGLEDPDVRRHVAGIIVPLAHRAWVDLTGENGRLPLGHDHYLKAWSLESPQAKVDYVMMDEGQDANPCVAGIVLGQRNTQTIAVGDENQQIYQWRGSVDALKNWPAKHRLHLSRSWRFGDDIAFEANRWLELLAAELRLTGNPNRASRVDALTCPDAVLCRTNAGAMSEAIAALKIGRRPAIVGGGDELRKLAEACIQLKGRGSTSHPDLYLFTSWGMVQDFVEQDDAGADLKVAVGLIDQYGPEELIAFLDQLAPEATADLIISTSHKAKGREWSQVRIGGDFTAPDDDADIPRPEAMLAYVAVTRAQLVLDRGSLEWIDRYVPAGAAAA